MKTIMRYYFILTKVAIMRQRITIAWIWGNWNPETLLVVIQNGAAALENSLVAHQKVKHRNTT